MNILLIGCGRVGKAITENLLDLKQVQKIYLFSKTSKSSKSLACELNSKKVKPIKSITNLKNIDYVIIALSEMDYSAREESLQNKNNTYEIRQDELKFNLSAVSQLITTLKTFSKETKIIVVTNPVDEITNFLRIILKKFCVLGFGLELDAKRLEKQLGKKIFCIGTHGKAIPLLNLKNKSEYLTIQKQTDESLLKFCRKNGIPHSIAGMTFKDFFERLNSEKMEIIHVSSYIKNAFGIRDISISLPFNVKKGQILGPAKISLNNIEKELFIESADELKKSIANILDLQKIQFI